MALQVPPHAPRPVALLFDLDDTIIDFTGNMERAWEAALAPVLEVAPGLEAAALRDAVERSRNEYWSDLERSERGRRDLRVASTEVVALAFETLGLDVPSDLPEAITVLERLGAAGYRLGLVTNGNQADQRGKIERFGLAGYFEHVQIEGELGVGKPRPQAYEHALATMSAPAEETWFIGDNVEWDVAAPQRHGMFGVWVSLGRTLPQDAPAEPDHIVERIGDLLDG